MLYDAVGWGGAIFILLAYFLVSAGKLSPSSKTFQALNLFGAAGVVANSVIHRASPAAGLNAVWVLIALYGLIKAFKQPAEAEEDEDEE